MDCQRCGLCEVKCGLILLPGEERHMRLAPYELDVFTKTREGYLYIPEESATHCPRYREGEHHCKEHRRRPFDCKLYPMYAVFDTKHNNVKMEIDPACKIDLTAYDTAWGEGAIQMLKRLTPDSWKHLYNKIHKEPIDI